MKLGQNNQRSVGFDIFVKQDFEYGIFTYATHEDQILFCDVDK